jgi:hypothetical protein
LIDVLLSCFVCSRGPVASTVVLHVHKPIAWMVLCDQERYAAARLALVQKQSTTESVLAAIEGEGEEEDEEDEKDAAYQCSHDGYEQAVE